MKIRFAFLLGSVLLAAGTGWSQNRLGDVAGSIKLNPEAIVEKKGFVEDPQAAQKEDHELFSTALTGCAKSADALGSLIEEARASILYQGDERVTSRLAAVALDLDAQLADFDVMRLDDAFDESMATASGAADFCRAATAGIREDLASRAVAFTRAREQIALCSQEFRRAEAQLATVGKTPEEVATMVSDETAPAAALTDEAIVAAVCDSVRGQGQNALDACEGRQYRALASIETRTPENELLAASIFNEIREICVELNPSNFDERNRCEIERMTAIRLEGE